MQRRWGALVGSTSLWVALDEGFLGTGSKPLDFLEGPNAGATLEPQSLYEAQRRKTIAPSP